MKVESRGGTLVRENHHFGLAWVYGHTSSPHPVGEFVNIRLQGLDIRECPDRPVKYNVIGIQDEGRVM